MEKEELAEEGNIALTISVFKTGDRKDFKNYRGITLL